MPAIHFFRVGLVLSLCSLFGSVSSAAEVKLLNHARAWEMAEFQIKDIPTSINNLDPKEIQIEATFTSGTGKAVTVPGFWYQDFARTMRFGTEELTAKGKGEWRVRFTPTAEGSYSVIVTEQRAKADRHRIAELSFSAEAAPISTTPRGWVQNAPDGRSFQTSDGRFLRLNGMNLCWSAGGGTYDYDAWFEKLQGSGQNFVRIWFSPWFLALEHVPNTLNNYRLNDAWQFDAILRSAEKRGIYVLLCFDHHGMYQEDDGNWGGRNNYWKTNPYSKSAGGPCAKPNDFFTSEAAREIYQKRLRYLIARYSYSSHLLGWEFFNEIDNVFAPRHTLVAADVINWHRVMGRWIHENDPFHHLVTSSLTGGSDRADLWNLPEMDFTGYHSYGDPAPAAFLSQISQDFIARYKKPVMIGEFGVSAQNWAIETDPHLRGFRQALWGSALGGSVGTALPWWWEEMDQDNVYPLFAALHQILETGGWSQEVWEPLKAQTASTIPTELADPIDNGTPFTASFSLSNYRRTPPSGKVGVANSLAAERASEAISGYLNGTIHPELHRPIVLAANFAEKAKLDFDINSVASDVEILVYVDGTEVSKTKVADVDGKGEVNHEINRHLSIDLAPGKHVVTISNLGRDWAFIENLKLEQVRPSHFVGDWKFHPEFVGLVGAKSKRALLYVNSPYVTYPAGARRYHPPILQDEHVTLPDWPVGSFVAHWFNPENGKQLSDTESTTAGGMLNLPLPPFGDDLAGIVEPAPPKK